MYRLIATPRFERRLARFRRAHPDLRRRILRVLADLRTDPHQPRLRLHRLAGEMEGLYAATVTYDYRVILSINSAEREITLIEIGSHNDVYR